MRTLLLAGVLAALASGSSPAQDPITVRNSDELRAALRRARPGTVVSLAPGDYRAGVWIEKVAGAKGKPIVIQGSDPKRPPVFADGGEGLHLSDCAHVTIRNITVKGCTSNGINIDDGGSIDTPAHHIVLEDVTVLETGPKGNHDGIKLSGLDDFALRRCRVEGWGGSAIDMVGCHRGVVEDCTFAGREGFSLHSGIQLKGGTRDILVHKCFFRDAGDRAVNLGGSTGLEFFRPRDAAFEAEDIVIAGNRFAGSTAPVAFVNSRNGHVHHNTFHLPGKWVLRILQEMRQERFPPCREGIFENNLVVFDERVRVFVNVGDGTAPKTFTFRRNAWFRTEGDSRPKLPTAESDGVHGVDPVLADAGTDRMRITSRDRRLRDKGADFYRPKKSKK